MFSGNLTLNNTPKVTPHSRGMVQRRAVLLCAAVLASSHEASKKDQNPTAPLSKRGFWGEQESLTQEQPECRGPPGWGHHRWVLVHATILLSPGALHPLAEVLKARAMLAVGFWPTAVKDQLVTHIHFMVLLATLLGEGAASPHLSQLWLPPFALRS